MSRGESNVDNDIAPDGTTSKPDATIAGDTEGTGKGKRLARGSIGRKAATGSRKRLGSRRPPSTSADVDPDNELVAVDENTQSNATGEKGDSLARQAKIQRSKRRSSLDEKQKSALETFNEMRSSNVDMVNATHTVEQTPSDSSAGKQADPAESSQIQRSIPRADSLLDGVDAKMFGGDRNSTFVPTPKKAAPPVEIITDADLYNEVVASPSAKASIISMEPCLDDSFSRAADGIMAALLGPVAREDSNDDLSPYVPIDVPESARRDTTIADLPGQAQAPDAQRLAANDDTEEEEEARHMYMRASQEQVAPPVETAPKDVKDAAPQQTNTARLIATVKGPPPAVSPRPGKKKLPGATVGESTAHAATNLGSSAKGSCLSARQPTDTFLLSYHISVYMR